MSRFKPDARFDKITDIPVSLFIENNIKGIILDVDNTLIDLNKNMLEKVEDWVDEVKSNNIKFVIASNTNKKEKVKKVSEDLQIHYIYFSCKPFKFGLKKAKKYLGLESENIAEIGDQVFTDVWGANRMNMFSILTKPIEQEPGILKKIKRKLEQKVL